MKKYQKNLIFMLILGLTAISTMSGFTGYKDLLRFEKAILIVLVFECIRISSIWAFVYSKWVKLIAVPVYFLVVICSALIGWVSLTSESIESMHNANKVLDTELNKRINIIKKEYANCYNSDIRDIDSKIDLCLVKLALNPGWTYYQNRLKQRRSQKEKLILERNNILKQLPEDKMSWIQSHAAILNVEFDPLPDNIQGTKATITALGQVTGLDPDKAQKYLTALLILTTELSIILLTLLLKDNNVSDNHMQKINEKEFRGFIEKCNLILKKHGRLPYARELGLKQRNLRKLLVK